jgi:hypothetical protein
MCDSASRLFNLTSKLRSLLSKFNSFWRLFFANMSGFLPSGESAGSLLEGLWSGGSVEARGINLLATNIRSDWLYARIVSAGDQMNGTSCWPEWRSKKKQPTRTWAS